jgi:hypothetical protein
MVLPFLPPLAEAADRAALEAWPLEALDDHAPDLVERHRHQARLPGDRSPWLTGLQVIGHRQPDVARIAQEQQGAQAVLREPFGRGRLASPVTVEIHGLLRPELAAVQDLAPFGLGLGDGAIAHGVKDRGQQVRA